MLPQISVAQILVLCFNLHPLNAQLPPQTFYDIITLVYQVYDVQ